MNFDVNAILTLAVPVLAPILTAGVKWLTPRIPPYLLPMICTGLGTLAVYITQWSTGTQTNAAIAIGLGLAGIGVREVLDQLRPSTPTSPISTPEAVEARLVKKDNAVSMTK